MDNALHLEMVLSLGEKYQYDQFHARNVERLAISIFDLLKEIHGMGEAELTLLRHGALLHDIGQYISIKKHHKHSAYLINYDVTFEKYPEQERFILSLLVQNHRKSVKIEESGLQRPRKMILSYLIAILRIADALDYFHRGNASVMRVVINNSECIFEIEGVDVQSLKEQLKKKSDFFKKVFGYKAVFVNYSEETNIIPEAHEDAPDDKVQCAEGTRGQVLCPATEN
ncbi:HD domain-containing protein [Desulforamulus aquiferis]|uniref:HD domain-containing protein n=1 Tax=Desulforamulus aquiferis TaxID=1397668 RepID=A0AAW7ZAT8_9FIRM|nr:HD domain-containing protein [Desulforamulus aquiferis]MDO7786769.1 HD domain-containing protein [Desulforamulus aquiferis]